MISKAIVPAAGLGTRLLPATKEQPKEMLPVFSRVNGQAVLKPILQVVYENIYNSGVREFCFITGRTKRAIEDHFTPHNDFLDSLKNNKDALESFYTMLNESRIFWINQYEPKGFGHAVMQAKNFAGSSDVLIHAGDTLIISDENHLKRLYEAHDRHGGDVTLSVESVPDPRKYGIVIGEKIGSGVYRASQLIEKPAQPQSNLAITGMYVCDPMIFKALEKTRPDKNNEIQLTDAIQLMVDWGMNIIAVEMQSGEKRIDIGTVDSYKEALNEVL